MFTGVYSVLPTPFTATGEVDFDSLKRVIDLYINAGVDGVTALGVTSEAVKLTAAERTAVLETCISHTGGRVRVIVGTSADSTAACVESTRLASALGASGVMISPPRMLKLNSEAIVRHFMAVAEAVACPIVLQDFPPVSGFHMEASLIARIVREVPAVGTIKMEDPPTPLKTARLLEQTLETRPRILGGLGGMYLVEELIAGSSGIMTGFAYPEILVRIVHLYQSGDHETAADLFYRKVALMRFEFQEGIGMAIRKEILRRRGALTTSHVRPPGAQLDPSTARGLDSLLEWMRKKRKDHEDRSIDSIVDF